MGAAYRSPWPAPAWQALSYQTPKPSLQHPPRSCSLRTEPQGVSVTHCFEPQGSLLPPTLHKALSTKPKNLSKIFPHPHTSHLQDLLSKTLSINHIRLSPDIRERPKANGSPTQTTVPTPTAASTSSALEVPPSSLYLNTYLDGLNSPHHRSDLLQISSL